MISHEMPGELPSQHRGWAMQALTLAWRLSLNAGSITRLVRVLRLPPFRETCLYNPRFALKSLGHNYLVRNFDSHAALECFVHHYLRMHSSFPERVLKTILHWDIPLHDVLFGEHSLLLSLGTSRPYDKEGELSLLFKVDSLILFTLTFTIVPGWAVGSAAGETCLISRLQGERSYADEVRLATKAMNNVRPRALLMAALQGIAMALGIEQIHAVSAELQSSCCERCASSFKNNYDGFFAELGLTRNRKGFFFSHLPLAEKPLELVDPKNRRTARKKQAFKAAIQQACARAILQASGQITLRVESEAPNAAETLILATNALARDQ